MPRASRYGVNGDILLIREELQVFTADYAKDFSVMSNFRVHKSRVRLSKYMQKRLGIIIAFVPFVLTLIIGISGFRAYDLALRNSSLETAIQIIGYILYLIGSLVCVLNFYLSFLRYPIHRWRYGEAKYHWVSGQPLFGTLFIMLGLIGMPHSLWPVILCFALLLIDTGGPLWFVKSVWHDDSFWERRTFNNK